MRRSFADFLDSMAIAMEADDITSEVANDLKDTVGGTPSTASDTDTRSNEEDLEKTDDIFDLKKDDDPTKNNSNDDNDNGTDDTTDESNNTDEDSTEEESDEENADNSDSDTGEELADDTSSNDLVFTKKNKIRDNIVQLYMIISGNIESIESSIININDESTIRVLNNIISHMRNCKTYMYNTLTKELKGLEYDELLRRYITIKKVYDICIEMMETHFKKTSKAKK